jgi:undecaprenyl-diphosphatase
MSIVPEEIASVAPPAEDAPDWLPWLGLAGALGAGTLVVLSIRTGGSAWPIDRTVHTWVLDHRGPVDLAVASLVTWLGATTVAIPVLAAVGAALPRGRRDVRSRLGAGVLLVGTASLGVWMGLLVNHAVGRERPPLGDWWGTAGGPAFPSGHTTAATVAAGTVAWAVCGRVKARGGRVAVWTSAVLVAGLVGWSRVWLGVHWPSDVVSGWLLGASWLALVVSGVAAVERRLRRRSERAWITARPAVDAPLTPR